MDDARAGSEPSTSERPTRGKGRPRKADGAAQSLATILHLVRTGQATTRQEIEGISELGRAIVADRLGTLVSLGLVDESGIGVATGGRAPRLVRFCQDAACVLVATLDQTAVGVGVADLNGTLLMEHHEAIDLSSGPDAVLERLCSLFDWILEKRDGGGPLWGIGISVPGPVPVVTEASFSAETPAALPGWEETPFIATLLARYKTPVWLRSSVETMTIGELSAGAGVNVKDMLFVKVGKRIGAGIVCDGRLYRGAQGAAGLIGQLQVQLNGRTGSLEAFAGSDQIAREGLEAARSGVSEYLGDILKRGGEINAIEVGQAAQTGDHAAMRIMTDSGHLVGHSVAALANILNPSLIVLSGSIVQTNDILLAAIRETVYGESHPMVTRDLRISRSQMTSSAGVVGAAMTVVDAIFDKSTLRGWIAYGSPLSHPDFIEARSDAVKRIALDGASQALPLAERGESRG